MTLTPFVVGMAALGCMVMYGVLYMIGRSSGVSHAYAVRGAWFGGACAALLLGAVTSFGAYQTQANVKARADLVARYDVTISDSAWIPTSQKQTIRVTGRVNGKDTPCLVYVTDKGRPDITCPSASARPDPAPATASVQH